MLHELLNITALQTKQNRSTLLTRIHGRNGRSPQAVTQEEPASGRTFKEALAVDVHRQAKAARSEMSMYPGKTFDDRFKDEVNKFMDQDRMGDIKFDTDTTDEEWNEHSEAEEDLYCEGMLETLAQLKVKQSSQANQTGGEASGADDGENKPDEEFAEYLEEDRDAGYDGDKRGIRRCHSGCPRFKDGLLFRAPPPLLSSRPPMP